MYTILILNLLIFSNSALHEPVQHSTMGDSVSQVNKFREDDNSDVFIFYSVSMAKSSMEVYVL